MTGRVLGICAGTALAMLLAAPSAALAADQAAPVMEALPPQIAARVDAQKSALEDVNLAGEGAPRGVVASLTLWPATIKAIRVCFFGGSDELRDKIEKIAMQWSETGAYVPLDFGPRRSCGESKELNHIRISFNQAGYWSVVGALSGDPNIVPQDQASMNFSGFDTKPPAEDEFRRVVLHEFGHALGLQHEHQNPFSACQKEFNFDAIYEILAQPPNNWSEKVVDHNMKSIHTKGLLATEFDPKSIMLYTFPSQFYKEGEKSSCFAPRNTELSETDKATMREMYPADEATRIALQKKRREVLTSHLAKQSASGATKSGVQGLIDRYVPDVK